VRTPLPLGHLEAELVYEQEGAQHQHQPARPHPHLRRLHRIQRGIYEQRSGRAAEGAGAGVGAIRPGGRGGGDDVRGGLRALLTGRQVHLRSPDSRRILLRR